MNRYLQEQARDAISRAQHTTRRKNFYLATGTWVMYFRWGKVTRGVIGAPPKSGLWLGPAPAIMTECRLGVTWKQTDQMSSHSAPSMQ